MKNMGTADRTIRAIAGAVLLYLGFTWATGGLGWLMLAIGAILLGTAAVGTCPAYLPFGLSTCRVK